MEPEVQIIPAPPGLTAQVRGPDADPLDPDDDHDTYPAIVLAIAWRAEAAHDQDQDGPVHPGTSYLVSIPLLGGAPMWRPGADLLNVAPEP
jgi:hypothetical protein